MAEPFNSVDDLLTFTAFRQGAGGPKDVGQTLKQSVEDGTFALSQLTLALNQAREEIYARCGEKDNDDYETWRLYQLKQAELYLATSTLYLWLGEKVSLKYPEANLGGVGNVQWGADTPSPLEKMKGWHEVAKEYRTRAENYMSGQGRAFEIRVSLEPHYSRRSCLAQHRSCCNGCCLEND